jgi:hypothetical protein
MSPPNGSAGVILITTTKAGVGGWVSVPAREARKERSPRRNAEAIFRTLACMSGHALVKARFYQL